jgi:hypothetical protein
VRNKEKIVLKEHISKIYIVSNKLSTDKLKNEFIEEGFEVEELRQEFKPEYRNFSKSYLCFLNHKNVWFRALNNDKYSLIVEEDFVPVENFGKLILPFDPSKKNFGICWFYSVGPQIYSVSKEGYISGESTGLVAYIINSKSAKLLLEFAADLEEKWKPEEYFHFDSEIKTFFLSRGKKNYLAYRNYGEHGGFINIEHKAIGIRRGGVHRADVLYGKLAFLPYYAKGKTIKYCKVRLRARIYGIMRLLVGRYLRPKVLFNSSTPFRLLKVALGRQLTLRL